MGILDSAKSLLGSFHEEVDPEEEKAKKLWQEVQDLRDSVQSIRRTEEQEWVRAWQFYKGNHWVTYNQHGNLSNIAASDKPRIVVNFILHTVQTKLGHLIKNKPVLTGVPENSDEESRNATRIGVKVLEAYWRKLRMRAKLTESILWTLIAGKCLFKVYWDPQAGGTASLPGASLQGPDGMPMMEQDGSMPRSEDNTIPLGDLSVEVAYPHEVYVDPGAQDIEHTTRLLHRTFKPISWVKKRYPEKAAKLQPIDPSTAEGMSIIRQLHGLNDAVASKIQDRIEVIEAWFRPSDEYPQGLFAVFAGGEQMESGPTPEGYPPIPFVSLDEIRTDTWYSTSTARQMIDTNKIIDIELSQQEHLRKVLRFKTLLPYQANISKAAWDERDDEIVEYFHPFKPEPYAPPSLPPHHIELRNSLIGLMKELSGNIDVMAGMASGETRSGRMVSYLQEYAGTVLGVVAQNVEQAIEDLGNMMLVILQDKVREDRMIPYIGRNRRTEILHFKGEDIKGMHSVIVQAGSALPLSRAERFDRIEHWMEQGWLDPAKGLKMLDMADPDGDMWAEDELDRENADEAIYKLQNLSLEEIKPIYDELMQNAAISGAPPTLRDVLRGLSIEAFEFDNHQIHIEQLNRGLRKTRRYREMPGPLRALVDALVDWHVMLMNGLDPDQPEASLLIPGQASQPGAAPGGQMGGMGGGMGGPQDPTVPDLGGAGQRKAKAENGAEQAQGLRPVRRPPGPGRPS